MWNFNNVIIKDWRIFGEPGWDDLFVNPKLVGTIKQLDDYRVLAPEPLDNGIPDDFYFNTNFDLG